MADQDESVREFVAVTDVDEERARFFLESAGWDLQLALASFFEDGAEDDIVTLPPPETGGSSAPRPAAPSSQPRVTSFRDLMHEEEDDSDEEEGQRFFAGGSERSGQQIVGPPKKKSSNEVVEDLFKGAKEHGAVPVEKAGRGPGEPSRARAFGGGGYRLGAAPEEQSAYVSGERRGANNQQDVHVVLKLWKTGFSLDEGELRNYSDPGNAIFLESIRRGEIPLELRQRSRGGQVNLDMEDHRDEDFSKPKVAFKAFGGEGQKLGRPDASATPDLVSLPSALGPQADRAASEAQASSSVTLDPSQPVTSIQIRLADGGRLVQKFNHTHSVSDVRQFLVAARPNMAATEFVLMTTFPNKELVDESQSLRDANLLNAVIVQRLK
ncbi:NSFL1 cofactor p47 isoform X1 [Osmerus eperlanus]|uniref:NSFL1 cofactor p47 isoform X1 n=1 Tax=Osmerus eperlanus TaxID=29151 RepID=UPI002E118FE4